MWVLLAEIAFRDKEYDKVRTTVEELRNRWPETKVLYQADEILGRSYKNQAQFEKARAAFGRVIADKWGRETETAAKCQAMLADTFLLQKNYKAAQSAYLKVAILYEYPELQAPALFKVAECDEVLNQWKDAVKTYESLLKEFPSSEQAAQARKRLQVARKKASG
ncbi:MAG: tetratricopeptide repeat protein [Proteobacteria bacterium]|nr:tetratricopeptide repeat protein [Pseudomonadota bacterium]